MIVVMRPEHTQEQADAVMNRMTEFGLKGQPIHGAVRTVIAGLGQVIQEHRDEISMMQGVDEVIRVTSPYKLSSRETHPADTVVELSHGVKVGGGRPVFMAGPCSIESEQQLWEACRGVRAGGAHILRGGAFKPRSSPYSFQGLGIPGLRMLREVGDELSMPVITECLSVRDIDAVAQYTDIIQIGARNMQNFVLLEEAGKTGKPVLLKRGMAGTIEEWLLASEYILSQDNPNVILCERGIRTFETATRNTLDLNAVALVKRLSHLPVISDPSHGTGKWYLVKPMTMASIAVGADGLIIEVHPNPDHALSDGAQSLTPSNFQGMADEARVLAAALNRPFADPPQAAARATA
ncbi:MAG: 3-deoxy-7-phosphoheptulonate synthase [Chloroflexi bacterium]|nr:3-deoxy-7-phosphoheptulonate synthase [Chloroflexota bacterium]MDA1009878.1 3-deoxy-7-phosphoheptulonate synthase [Chloroflexota bacterium]MQC25311.1 3-deoxy-7-phosphoheptulonate synthase [Chloroflexota bacterium]MQC47487.1 3-deoxy-7-phosphoheptulonate synthase [Chloroflexota bacterium]